MIEKPRSGPIKKIRDLATAATIGIGVGLGMPGDSGPLSATKAESSELSDLQKKVSAVEGQVSLATKRLDRIRNTKIEVSTLKASSDELRDIIDSVRKNFGQYQPMAEGFRIRHDIALRWIEELQRIQGSSDNQARLITWKERSEQYDRLLTSFAQLDQEALGIENDIHSGSAIFIDLKNFQNFGIKNESAQKLVFDRFNSWIQRTDELLKKAEAIILEVRKAP